MTPVRNSAVHDFVGKLKGAMTHEQKRTGGALEKIVRMSYKDETDPYSGIFGVQVEYGRLLREKDLRHAPPELRDTFFTERISLYPTSFGPGTKPWDRFLRLRRAKKKPLPVKEYRDGLLHLYRDSTVSLKPGGKWKINAEA